MIELRGAWLAGVAAATLLACGGDDNGPPLGGPDAGNDAQNPGIDGAVPGTDAGPDAGGRGDGGDAGSAGDGSVDAGCNFATFVKGLVAADTTMTALPSTDLGQECTDNQNQAEFQSLFP